MSKNIKISSGSDFSKKKFGLITKLTKPTFVHNGKVFSNNTFKNQRTIPLLENNIYYTNHGLPEDFNIYEYKISNFGPINIQSYMEFLIQSADTGLINPIQLRAFTSTIQSNPATNINSVASSLLNVNDPYNNNPPPECPLP